MTPERWQQICDLLEKALELAPEQRPTLLDRACGADPSMRQEVETLLASSDDVRSGFLQASPLEGMLTSRRKEATPDSDRSPRLIGQTVSHYRIVEKIGGGGMGVVYNAEDNELQLAPGKRIGAYEILEEIAQGGMGAVYRVVRADGQYKQQVALKIVRADLGAQSTAARFRNERQILANLDHLNIAKILDGGTTAEGLPYFVMELIDGLPITEYCDQHKLTIDVRLQLFRSVCSAVHYAHQRLVIHRDLKPTNIFVTRDGVPKLLDFGIAKILDPNLLPENTTMTVGGLWLMTPEYASPEQLRGETITTATDVYSLGLVLYQLLTGHKPYRFSSRMPHDVARTIFETDPEKPSMAIRRTEEAGNEGERKAALTPELVSGLRGDSPERLHWRLAGDLDNIVMKAIRKDPSERYNSADQLSEDLRRHLAGLPVSARKDTFSYRTSKFISRHKLGVASGAIATLAIFMGLAATLYEAHLARVQRARAEARFNDVRALANSLMFDVHDSIQDLPGSTPARKLLVERALRYLDTLSRDTTSDASLQRELATAYEKVGTVQGNPFGANLGDTQGALESYGKSLAIWQSLANGNAFSLDDRVAQVRVQRLILAVQANRGDASTLGDLRQSIASLEQVLRTAGPAPVVLQELGTDYRFLGVVLDGSGNYQAALENFQKALPIIEQRLAAAPDDATLRGDLATTEARIGHELAGFDSIENSFSHFKRALEVFESLAADGKNEEASRRLAYTHFYLAEALQQKGGRAAALHHHQEQQRIVAALAAKDPTNSVVQLDLACGTARLGNATALTGKSASGLGLLNQSIRMLETQIARDPAYAEPQNCLWAAWIWMGETHERVGAMKEAVQDYQKGLAIYQKLAARNNWTAGRHPWTNAEALMHAHLGSALVSSRRLDHAVEEFDEARHIVEPIVATNGQIIDAQYVLADAYSGLGDVSRILASDVQRPVHARIRDWNEAKTCYARSLEAWQEIQNPGARTPMGFGCGDPKEVVRKLAECDAALSSLEPTR
jgi:non-specific serine/threonine protein kinase/serine/threonine-protein kinase